MKRCDRLMAFAESVIGNSWVQVMHMVESDVAGEPVQQWGKAKIGGAPERRIDGPPVAVPHPNGLLESMLHREQPHPYDRCRHHDRHLHSRDVSEPEQKAQPHNLAGQRRICDVHGSAFMPVGLRRVEWHSVKGKEDQRRQEEIGDKPMPCRAMPPTLSWAQCEILADGQAEEE